MTGCQTKSLVIFCPNVAVIVLTFVLSCVFRFRAKITMVFQGQDAWRRHPLFQNLWKDPFPGFKKAVIIYGVFVVCEYSYKMMTAPPRPKAVANH